MFCFSLLPTGESRVVSWNLQEVFLQPVHRAVPEVYIWRVRGKPEQLLHLETVSEAVYVERLVHQPNQPSVACHAHTVQLGRTEFGLVERLSNKGE